MIVKPTMVASSMMMTTTMMMVMMMMMMMMMITVMVMMKVKGVPLSILRLLPIDCLKKADHHCDDGEYEVRRGPCQ